MAENDFTPPMQPEPELRQTKDQPQGVLKKNLKTFVYLGAALLVIVQAWRRTGKCGALKQLPSPMSVVNFSCLHPFICFADGRYRSQLYTRSKVPGASCSIHSAIDFFGSPIAAFDTSSHASHVSSRSA